MKVLLLGFAEAILLLSREDDIILSVGTSDVAHVVPYYFCVNALVPPLQQLSVFVSNFWD